MAKYWNKIIIVLKLKEKYSWIEIYNKTPKTIKNDKHTYTNKMGRME